jgi:hypothetical protein
LFFFRNEVGIVGVVVAVEVEATEPLLEGGTSGESDGDRSPKVEGLLSSFVAPPPPPGEEQFKQLNVAS